MTKLIYCAATGRKFAEIAIKAGYLYGAQMPAKVYFSPMFVDQNWKNPRREKYMAKLAEHKPLMATVLDFERMEQLNEILGWAEEAAQFVEEVVIIPKVRGGIELIPRQIGNKAVILGYSVPSSYGGTILNYGDFRGWPVHLLGGSPSKQLKLRKFFNVHSADCNAHMGMAQRFNKFWANGKWVRLDSLGYVSNDAPYRAFELSCANILAAWQEIKGPLC